jgi:hypothetical protein
MWDFVHVARTRLVTDFNWRSGINHSQAVVHRVDSQQILDGCLASLAHDAAVGVREGSHGGEAVSAECSRTVVHDTADIVGNAKVSDLRRWTDLKVALAASRNVPPVDPQVLVAIERVVHVMEAEGVNKLVDNGEEPKAAGVNRVRLQTNSLSATNATDLSSAANRVASDENVINLGCAVNEANASALAQVLCRIMNVPNVVVICKSLFLVAFRFVQHAAMVLPKNALSMTYGTVLFGQRRRESTRPLNDEYSREPMSMSPSIWPLSSSVFELASMSRNLATKWFLEIAVN